MTNCPLNMTDASSSAATLLAPSAAPATAEGTAAQAPAGAGPAPDAIQAALEGQEPAVEDHKLVMPELPQQYVLQREAKIPLSSIELDLGLTHGQVRPLDLVHLASTRESFKALPPLSPVHVLLVAQDHTSMLPGAHAQLPLCSPHPQTPSGGSLGASTPSRR